MVVGMVSILLAIVVVVGVRVSVGRVVLGVGLDVVEGARWRGG